MILHSFESCGKKWLIKKPSRTAMEDIRMFYAREFHKCLKSGIGTMSQLRRYYSSADSVLTSEEEVTYAQAHEEWTDVQEEMLRLSGLPEEPNVEERISKLKSRAVPLMLKIQSFESLKADVFQNTSEEMAKARAVVYSFFKLLYRVDVVDGEEKEVLVFGKKNHDKNLDDYDEWSEGDDADAYHKGMLYASVWYSGKASTKEDFEAIDQILEASFGDSQNTSGEDSEAVRETKSIEKQET